MAELVDRPGLLLIVSFAGFLLAALLGVVAQRVWRPVQAGDQNELTIVQTAALTLLGLIVGFSFSMAVTRYDQRKNLEEAEANAVSGRPFCLLACAIPLSHCLLGERDSGHGDRQSEKAKSQPATQLCDLGLTALAAVTDP